MLNMLKKLISLLALIPIIASAGGVATPPVVVEGFGVNAGGSYITNPIPVPSQIGITPCRASYNDGFPPLSMTPVGGCNPFGQDMNGVLFAATQNTAAWIGGQYWPFNSTFATANGGYAVGAIVAMAANNGFWLNISSGNTNNPDTSTPGVSTGWVPLVGYTNTGIADLTSGAVTLTAAQAAAPILFLSGTLTGNAQVILPNWSKLWVVINGATGNYTVTLKTAGGSGVIVPQSGASAPTQVYCDGSNIQMLSTVNQTLSAHKASATTRASTTTQTNDPDLVLVIPAAGTYQISGELFFGENAGGGGINVTLASSGTATQSRASMTGYVNASAVTVPAFSGTSMAILTASAADSGSTVDWVDVSGTLLVTAPGTYSVQWAQNSSNSNGTFMATGSFVKLTPIN